MENITNIGTYQIIGEIDRGDLSVVYQAKQSDKENIEALKLFSDQLSTKQDFALTFHRDSPPLSRKMHYDIE